MLALGFNHLAAVAFVPPRDVHGAYEELLDSAFFVTNLDLLEPFINYFEYTWEERPAAAKWLI